MSTLAVIRHAAQISTLLYQQNAAVQLQEGLHLYKVGSWWNDAETEQAGTLMTVLKATIAEWSLNVLKELFATEGKLQAIFWQRIPFVLA